MNTKENYDQQQKRTTMNTKTARATWLAVSAGIGLLLFGVSTAHAQVSMVPQESENNLTRFRVTVPVNLTRMSSELRVVFVACEFLDESGHLTGGTRPRRIITLNADGSYTGNLTFLWGVGGPNSHDVNMALVPAEPRYKGAICRLTATDPATEERSTETNNFVVSDANLGGAVHPAQVLPNPAPVLSVTGNFPVRPQ